MHQFSCMDSEIFVGSIQESNFSKLLSTKYAHAKKAILVDSNTNEQCLPYLFSILDGLEDAEIIELPPGEENKHMQFCHSVWEALSEMEFGRKDILICAGGGVICDMGGFIASIYKRGMNCMYIPTSLLGMVDASLGGKTGVDLGSFKNQLGTFSFPSQVYIDSTFLQTLPEKELLNGWSEMLKHGLVYSSNHFLSLSAGKTDLWTNELIQESLLIKSTIVEKDPFEKGERKLLNFGHTVGHAIEGHLLHTDRKMDHGLAVAHGMLVESRVSVLMNLLSEEDFHQIEEVLKRFFTFQSFSQDEVDAFVQLMTQDKKRVGNTSRFTLLKAIGNGVYDIVVSDEVVQDGLQLLVNLEE